MTYDTKKIKQILKILEDSKFNEISWEEADFKVNVKKYPSDIDLPAQNLIPRQITAESPRSLPSPHGAQETEIELTEGRAIIRSPLVGTFYRSSSPNASPFVDSGDRIKPGQVLCIIEAMKLMNEVECDRGGKIAAILVENAQPVEYGEPLFIIETENEK